MTVRPRPHWLQMLFVWRGSVLPIIVPQLPAITAFSAVVTLLHGQVFQWKVPLNFAAFTLVGLTLAIFLGFRNNTSYARFWEARTLWGATLSETRSLLRQGLTLAVHDADVGALAARLIAFVHALRHQLRSTDAQGDFDRLRAPDDCERLAQVRYAPAMLLPMVGEWIRDRLREGGLVPALVPAMEGSLDRLTEALGGCERIAVTPISRSRRCRGRSRIRCARCLARPDWPTTSRRKTSC